MSLKGQIRRYLVWFIAIAVLIAVAVPTGIYILHKQRFVAPWTDFYYVDAEFRNAEATVAGQGQKVTIAGVDVGEVDGVDLEGGLAIVRLRIENRHAPIYRDAEIIRRPRTALKDLEFMLDPGDPKSGRIPDGGRLPSTSTGPKNTDEFLATVMDADSRRGLQLVIAGLGGLADKGMDLRRVFEAGEPTIDLTRRVLRSIAGRRSQLKRLVGNLNAISAETAEKDDEIAAMVKTLGETFDALGDEDVAVRESLRRLPGTVNATSDALREGGALSDELRPAAEDLRPALRAAPEALRRVTPLLKEAAPILRDRVRPLIIKSRPVARDLGPASRDLRRAASPLLDGTPDLNRLVNELLYNPPGADEPYVFYAPWFAHNAASMLSTGDAHGHVWRGLVPFSCSTIQGIETVAPVVAAAFNVPTGICPDRRALEAGG